MEDRESNFIVAMSLCAPLACCIRVDSLLAAVTGRPTIKGFSS